jgi:hypothetical protein
MDFIEVEEDNTHYESFPFNKRSKGAAAPKKKRQVRTKAHAPPPASSRRRVNQQQQEEEEEEDEDEEEEANGFGQSSEEEEEDDDGFIDRSPEEEEHHQKPRPRSSNKRQKLAPAPPVFAPPVPSVPLATTQEIVAVSNVQVGKIPKKPGRTTSPKPIMNEKYPQYQAEYLFCKYLCDPVGPFTQKDKTHAQIVEEYETKKNGMSEEELKLRRDAYLDCVTTFKGRNKEEIEKQKEWKAQWGEAFEAEKEAKQLARTFKQAGGGAKTAGSAGAAGGGSDRLLAVATYHDAILRAEATYRATQMNSFRTLMLALAK